MRDQPLPISATAMHPSGVGQASVQPVAQPNRNEVPGDSEVENPWQLALEGASVGVWDWDLLTGAQKNSPRWAEMLGYQADELTQGYQDFITRLHPDDLSPMQTVIKAYLQGTAPGYTIDFRLRCKDGAWKWIMSSGKIVSRNAQGQPTRVIGTHTDISERKQKEAELLALNAQLAGQTNLLQTTLASIDQGILMVDADQRVSTFNPQVCQMLSFSADLLASRPSTHELTRLQLERGDFGPDGCRVEAEVRAQMLRVAHGANDVIANRYQRVTPGGRTLDVHTQLVPTGGFVRTFADITELVQAEAARQRADSLVQAIQVIGRIGAWEVDIANDRLEWTEGVFRMFETSPEEYQPTRQSSVRFFTPAALERVQASYAAEASVSALNRNHDFELEMITAKGRHIWVRSRGTTVWPDGRAVKRTAIVQDITEHKLAQTAFQDSEARWQLALESTGDGVWDWNIQTGEEYSSQRLLEMFGFKEHEQIDEYYKTYYRVHPDDEARIKRDHQAHFDGLTPTYINEHRVRCKDGSWKWVLSRGMVISRDAQGKPLRMVGTHTDISERKQIEQSLRDSEQRWKLAIESVGDGMWDWHIDTGEEFHSRKHQDIFGYTPADIPNRADAFDKLIHPDDLDHLAHNRQQHFDGLTHSYADEHRVRCKDGSWKWVLSRGMVVSRDAHGQALRMIGTATDISERKKAEAMIWQQAHFDTLTGLPNRNMLRDRMSQELKRSKRDGKQLAVLFIDLDHFKEVNDTLGHDRGDRLLVQAAQRICDCVRESDTVARMGGDEFAVILTELFDTASLERILQDILKALEAVFELEDERVFVSASIGVTMFPLDAYEIEGLFKNADQALYVAKGAGRNRYSFFTAALQEAAQYRARLATDLHVGLLQQQFRLVYQPIVELATGAIRKAEALIRWQHPTHGLVSPAEFIPIAEASGLIVEIGEWVFQQATRQVQAWRRTLDPDFQISVNKSPVQFRQIGKVLQPWEQQLQAMGLPGESIVVEITEGLLLDTSASVADHLLELHDAGIQVSLDDFGTGYSSLSYLQRFDIDFVKIDQSFVRYLNPDSTDLALCKAIIVMAHALGMKVIAEGVETAQQRDLLAAAGCDYGQGYLFSRPIAASDFEAFIAERASAAQDNR